jgi:hypothetical protein
MRFRCSDLGLVGKKRVVLVLPTAMKEREYKTNISSRVGRVRPDYKQKRLDTHFHENVEENDNEGHHITASDL